jgi:hypothetical protein
MWERAGVLLDRSPYCAVTRPLAGAALGAAAGALFGALCGAVLAVSRGVPALLLSWLLVSAAAGTAAGFIMGVCNAVDRIACRRAWELDAKWRQRLEPSANRDAVKPPDQALTPIRSRNLVNRAHHGTL